MRRKLWTLCALLAAIPTLAQAQASGGGKLLLTGGVSSAEGTAGGGLTPWAVTGGYGSAGQWGGSVHATRVMTQDYGLNAYGALLAWHDRFELSLARQDFDTGMSGAALGLPGLRLKQDIVGAKLRLAGDAVLDSDRWMPQIAIGLQHKRLDAGGLAPTLEALGARRSGTDVYLSAPPSSCSPRACCSTPPCAPPRPTRPVCSASAARGTTATG